MIIKILLGIAVVLVLALVLSIVTITNHKSPVTVTPEIVDAAQTTNAETVSGGPEVSNMIVNPGRINPGEPVKITVDAFNGSGIDGKFSIAFTVNDKTEAVNDVFIPADESRTVSFVIVKNDPGIYKVTAGDAAGQFEVIKVINISQPDQVSASSSCCSPVTNPEQSCCGTGNTQSTYTPQYNSGSGGSCCEQKLK